MVDEEKLFQMFSNIGGLLTQRGFKIKQYERSHYILGTEQIEFSYHPGMVRSIEPSFDDPELDSYGFYCIICKDLKYATQTLKLDPKINIALELENDGVLVFNIYPETNEIEFKTHDLFEPEDYEHNNKLIESDLTKIIESYEFKVKK